MEPNLSTVLLERASLVMKMKACGLSLSWLKEYSLPCLLASCDRKQESLPEISITDTGLQRELIENREFAAWLAGLLPLLPEDPPAKPEPQPAYNSRGYHPQPAKTPPSRRSVLLSALRGLLETCTIQGKDITSYPQSKVMEMLGENLTGYLQLVYLENFAFEELSEDMEKTIRVNLQRCHSVPLVLTEKQKSLLVEPYVTTRQLFSLSPFEEVLALLDNRPGLLKIIMLLHEKLIYEELDLTNYNVFAQDETEYFRLLESLISLAGHDAANRFLGFWKKNGCPLRELRKIEAQVRENPELDWTEHLSTHAGYINQVYGVRFKHIDLASVSKYQEDILIHAIVKNKRHFIKLVDNQADLFLDLPSTSILFQESLYLDHFNLNELTGKELNDCAWMITQKLSVESLVPDRRYTFPELRALYDTPKQYIRFYHALQSENQDYRLKVLRQVQKRNLLRFNMEDTEITALAARLDEKPLDTWMQTDFSHIVDLTASDTVQVLICLDRLRHLLPSIQTRTEVSLALRNLDVLDRYESIAELKENLLQTDKDWLSLIEQMNLTPAFLEKHRVSIIRFLCNDGAHISVSYQNRLNDNQKEAFLRVVKAELMGQLDTLKYYDGDLQRELDSPLANQVNLAGRKTLPWSKMAWKCGSMTISFRPCCWVRSPRGLVWPMLTAHINPACCPRSIPIRRFSTQRRMDGWLVGLSCA